MLSMKVQNKVCVLLCVLLCMCSLIVAPIPVRAAAQATYYVSPTGSDSNPGTQSQPFATLTKAQNFVRSINSNMTADIIINLMDGVFTLSSSLQLGTVDSGIRTNKMSSKLSEDWVRPGKVV